MPVYKKINKNFFKTWSVEMAYVVGFFMADGNMIKTKRDTYFISFNSADEYILKEIRKVMDSNHKISRRSSYSGNLYRLQIGSREIFNDLLMLGLNENKTKRMRVPKMPSNVEEHFIRGYFDGDGNIWMGQAHRSRLTQTLVLITAFTSGCEEFLRDLLATLHKAGIKGGSICEVRNKGCSRLNLSTNDSLKLYEIMYNTPHMLRLDRKKRVFERFIKLRV